MLQELIRPNLTESWHSGPLGNARFYVSQSSTVGLTACQLDDPSNINNMELRIFYGAFDNLVHLIKWRIGDQSWTPAFVLNNVSGTGALACNCSSTMYLFSINPSNQIELWWKDMVGSSNGQGVEPSHPLGAWTKGAPLFHRSSRLPRFVLLSILT